MIQTIVNNLDELKDTTNQVIGSGYDCASKSSAEFSKVFEEKLSQKQTGKINDATENRVANDKTTNDNDIKINDAKISKSDIKTIDDVKSVVSDLKSADVKLKDVVFIGKFNTKDTEDEQNDSSVILQGLLNSLQNPVLMQDLESLKEVIDTAMSEAKLENSLDLTLAKDVEDIVSQIQSLLDDIANNAEQVDKEQLEELAGLFSQLVETFDKIPTEKIMPEQITKTIETLSSQLESHKEQMQKIVDKDDTTVLQEDIQLSDEDIIDFAEKVSQKTDSENSETTLDMDAEMLEDLKLESIQAETESTGGDLMQNQSAQEQGVKAMLTQDGEFFDVRIEKATSTQASSTVQVPQNKTIDVNPSRIIEQITKHMEAMQNGSKVSLVLNPENLGRVNIQLMTTKDGLMAQFTVTTTEARDLLMKGLDGLKETLISQGVGVDNVSVKLSESEKSTYEQDWTEQDESNGGNKGQRQQEREEKEKGLFEQVLTQTTSDLEDNGKV